MKVRSFLATHGVVLSPSEGYFLVVEGSSITNWQLGVVSVEQDRIPSRAIRSRPLSGNGTSNGALSSASRADFKASEPADELRVLYLAGREQQPELGACLLRRCTSPLAPNRPTGNVHTPACPMRPRAGSNGSDPHCSDWRA